ncbi:TIGR03364 family FAD-dependent oxidoreductase [Rhodovibrio salinarum]|uniref:TIGR03364 family FAD-dependent oxidoreductase n=1 Tax=Rhodovibrio salinarum TaxID=1087 RepID=A0A934V0Q4_9PROT|nr:TIGR03364 family FAD-dependent oxidoreductase [Rhodovibrio salinarum]MBK1698532.1 TIGR03364 family FAD-dependent oxidoreductase [Rhodovibrio salinarum]
MSQGPYDLAVVGAGIVGLAHALAARRLGKRVIVLDREAANVGASIRNFGFVTVTGQERGAQWCRALRSRDVWDELAGPAGIANLHSGLTLAVQTEEGLAVVESFLATEMGADCRLLDPDTALARYPHLNPEALQGVLESPHERRVEARQAIARLTHWLAEALGVTFAFGVNVRAVDPPRVETSAGPVEAGAIAICPGSDATGPFAERLADYGLSKCKLHMLRAAPLPGTYRQTAAVMGDLSLVRYPGYADLAEAADLTERLEAEPSAGHALAHGIHLIAVQSADGSLVLGDSHAYADAPDPFQPAEVDDAILNVARATLALDDVRVTERWTGVYAACAGRENLIDRPRPDVRQVVITSGTGMSTAFALAEESVGELFDRDPSASPLPV